MINSDTSLGRTVISPPPCGGKIEISAANSASTIDGVSNMSSFSEGFNDVHCGANYQIGAAASSLRVGGGSVEADAFAVLEGENPGEAWKEVSRSSTRVVRDRCDDYDEFGYNWYGFCKCDVHEEDARCEECSMCFSCNACTCGEDEDCVSIPEERPSIEVVRMRHNDSLAALLREQRLLAQSREEEAPLLSEFPKHLEMLLELDARIISEQKTLKTLSDALARGWTYGAGIDEIADAINRSVREEYEAFAVTQHEQDAAMADRRVQLEPLNIRAPPFPREPTHPGPRPANAKAVRNWEAAIERWNSARQTWIQECDRIKAGHRAAIAAERVRTRALNDQRALEKKPRVDAAVAANDAAKKAWEAAKVRALPLLVLKMKAQIAELDSSGKVVSGVITTLGARLASIIASTHDVSVLAQVVKMDSILLAAEEKRERMGGMISICLKTHVQNVYDDDGDLIGAQKQILPKVLDFAPLSLSVKTYADVLSLAQYKEPLARLYPEGPDVARMLCQLEEIRTRSSASAPVAPVVVADVRPERREAWGEHGKVEVKQQQFAPIGGVTVRNKSLMSTNSCNNFDDCTNAYCCYQHGPKRAAVLAKDQAKHKPVLAAPVASAPAEDKVATYLSLLASGESTRLFTIAKVSMWPDENRMQVTLADGSIRECIRSGHSVKIGEIILMEGDFMRGKFKGKQLAKLEATVPALPTAFFAQRVTKPQGKIVVKSRVSTLEESGLPLPPSESEGEESDEEA